MKHVRKTIVRRTLLMTGVLMSLGSCATLFSPKTTPVILVDAPSDLKVKVDGQPTSMQRVQSQAKSGSEVTVTYYAQGLELDKKVKRQTLTLESNGKSKETEVVLKASGGMIFLDLIFTGPIGIGVDAATKRWRKAKNRHIDVPAVLNGTEPRNQRKLKKAIRQEAKS